MIIAVMTIFVTHVKPSEAGYGYRNAGQGAGQYFQGEMSNNNDKKILGTVMFGLAILGGIVSGVNKK